MTETEKKYRNAIEQTKEFLKTNLAPDEEVQLHFWGTDAHGLRLSEFTLLKRTSTGIGGSSFMRGEPDAGGVLLAIEDLVIAFYGMGIHGDDEAKEMRRVKDRLLWHFKKK